MEGSTRYRRTTLSDQMSVLDASNLRDLLRVRDDEDDGRHALAGLTLGAVLGCEDRRTRIPTSRTLLEIIKDEESGAAYRGLVPNQNNKKRWRSLKDRLRLRRAGVAWSSSIEDCRIQISHPFSADPTTNNTRRSIAIAPRITSSDSETENSIPAMILPERNESQVVENVPIVSEIDTNVTDPSSSTVEEPIMADRGEEQRPVRMSLMALLEETDRQAGGVGSSALLVGTEEEEEKEEDDKVEGGGEEYVCCVCMVRHKGAAFIPCGHTFCRLCSRELWVSRGNCPICNGFILEILDIF